ncbi:MAG: PAS domain-containing methyl-accepting chemotaxis protein [Treponema sp.]|nr:PAS domain-containing methyl-accepting chemotaxis protein [Treponema sp.]
MEKMDTSKSPRVKLIAGIIPLAFLAGALVPVVAGLIQNQTVVLGIIAFLVAAALGCGPVLAWRTVRRVERESFEEGMRLLVESSPMIFNQFKVATTSPIYCNGNALKVFGLKDRQEFCNKLFTHLIPEYQPDGTNSMALAAEYIKKTMKEGTSSVDLWHQTLRGDKLPLRCNLASARIHGEDHLMIFSVDIRHELEAESRKEEAVLLRMRTIMDSVPMVCAIFDENAKILEVNREVEKMFGVPDRQTYIDNYYDFLPKYQPDGTPTKEGEEKAAEIAIAQGVYRHDWTYKLKDGTPIPVEEYVQPILVDGRHLIIVYTRDVRESHAIKEKEQAAQKRLQETTDKLNEHLEVQATAITESSAAMQEMIANISSVSGTLSKNAANVKDLQAASEVGQVGLRGVASDIQEIAKESESLLGINSVMKNIASQTNLLSMNAAIEAAHAGDSGRGFAVVASEIRKLAESSSAQSKTINDVLKKIKSSIDKITKSTESVMQKFEVIGNDVKIVAEQESGILNAMTEQSAGSTQIMRAIAQVNEITSQIKTDARKMVEAAAKLGL